MEQRVWRQSIPAYRTFMDSEPRFVPVHRAGMDGQFRGMNGLFRGMHRSFRGMNGRFRGI